MICYDIKVFAEMEYPDLRFSVMRRMIKNRKKILARKVCHTECNETSLLKKL